jgi:hypothetical protein
MCRSKGKYSLAAWQIKSFRVRGIEVRFVRSIHV